MGNLTKKYFLYQYNLHQNHNRRYLLEIVTKIQQSFDIRSEKYKPFKMSVAICYLPTMIEVSLRSQSERIPIQFNPTISDLHKQKFKKKNGI